MSRNSVRCDDCGSADTWVITILTWDVPEMPSVELECQTCENVQSITIDHPNLRVN